MVVFSLSSSVFAQQQIEYKKIYRLGVASLEKNGVKTLEGLVVLILKERAVINLLLGGRKDLVEEFYRQFNQTRVVDEMVFDKSDQIQLLAMSWRNWDKEPKITVPVELALEGITEAYIFKIDYMQIGRSYWFLTPKNCGNISLWKIEELKIEKVEEKIKEPLPKLLVEPPVQKLELPKPEPPATIKSEGGISYSAGMAIGGFYSCFENCLAVEFEAKRKLLDGLDLMATIRVGVPIGSDAKNWNTVPMIGFSLIGRVLDPFYLGAGVGFSGKMKEGQSSQVEFSVTTGFQDKNIDFFFEGRAPFKGDPRGILGNYKIFVGFRVLFGK